MNHYEIIKSKKWVNIITNQTASIYGGVPYITENDKKHWVIKEFGWTLYNNKSNTVGIGRIPFTTYFQALNHLNTLQEI